MKLKETTLFKFLMVRLICKWSPEVFKKAKADLIITIDYDHSKPSPMVFDLHGFGDSADLQFGTYSLFNIK